MPAPSRRMALNGYPTHLALVIDGHPVNFHWTAEQRRHLMADLAEIVARDLRGVQ
jgi:hypothetical protein